MRDRDRTATDQVQVIAGVTLFEQHLAGAVLPNPSGMDHFDQVFFRDLWRDMHANRAQQECFIYRAFDRLDGLQEPVH